MVNNIIFKKEFIFSTKNIHQPFLYIFRTKAYCAQSDAAKTSMRTKALRLLIYHVSTALFVSVCVHVHTNTEHVCDGSGASAYSLHNGCTFSMV